MRPYQRLPLPMPSEHDPSEGNASYFYDNFVHHFIPDMLRMTTTGLNINQEAVEELRTTIDKVLDLVTETLGNSPIIAKYQKKRYPKIFAKYKEEVLKSVRTVSHYLRGYDKKNVIHRTFVVNAYLMETGGITDIKEKWTLKDLKEYNVWCGSPTLYTIVDGTLDADNQYALLGMKQLAEHKLELWNKPRYDKVKQGIVVPPFNPASSLNKKEFFEMVGSGVLARSKDTGEASWGRKEIEILFKETPDGDLKDVLQAFIDHSFSGIIKNNFLAAFDSYTIDDILYGSIKLFGAKSFRPTGNSPNMLQMPSTGSIYATPLKKCLVAPEGMLIYAIDYSALEDRVIANISGDVNKLKVFTDGLDGHSLAAVFYQPEEAEKILGKFTDKIKAAKLLKNLVDSGNKEAKNFRQFHKATSFGLAYGKFPDSDSGGIITQEIFDAYHNDLYPQITEYRENYVLPTTKKNGYIHLGMGCRLWCDDADKSIRTINNATIQFFSILTLISLNEINFRIREEGLSDDIQAIATIYDSIYFNVRKDSTTIKWLNDNLVSIMTSPYLENEIVHNEAVGEISNTWADMVAVPNNSSTEDIDKIIEAY